MRVARTLAELREIRGSSRSPSASRPGTRGPEAAGSTVMRRGGGFGGTSPFWQNTFKSK